MIRTTALCRRFGDYLAVDGLDLEIARGEVFGILGPNGAGKTTTVRMLAALIAPSDGAAWIDGLKIGERDDEIRGRIGLLTETPGLFQRLNAIENLTLFARLHGVSDPQAAIERLLRMLGLWERRDVLVAEFSKGMQQKLAIARALLHDPPLLFLDEPTSALDPHSASIVRGVIEELTDRGRTIVLCTHNLDEADRLCDRIAVIKQRLLKVAKPDELRQQLYGQILVEQVYLSIPFLLWSSLVLIVANLLLLRLAVRLFQREAILTRWK